jgi:hypothetical protein
MGKPYSMDLRERARAAVSEAITSARADAAAILDASLQTSITPVGQIVEVSTVGARPRSAWEYRT